MTLFYMCCKHNPADGDASSKRGIYMPGKIWDRRGADPIKTRAWYCGAEKSEWEKLVQKHLVTGAKCCRDQRKAHDYQLDLAFKSANFGCGCRFHGFKETNDGGAMVLEVIDKSVPGTCTMYASVQPSRQHRCRTKS